MAYAKAGYSLPAYAYAINNPLYFVDEDGFNPVRSRLAYWLFRLAVMDPANPINRPPSDPDIKSELERKTSKKRPDNQCSDNRPPADTDYEMWKQLDGYGYVPPWTPVMPIPSLPPYVPLPTIQPVPVPAFP